MSTLSKTAIEQNKTTSSINSAAILTGNNEKDLSFNGKLLIANKNNDNQGKQFDKTYLNSAMTMKSSLSELSSSTLSRSSAMVDINLIANAAMADNSDANRVNIKNGEENLAKAVDNTMYGYN